MAEILVSAASNALIEKLVAVASNEISLVWGVRDEISSLQTTLHNIQLVLTDAERQQVEKDPVKFWLENLKDVVYEAEEILDEFEYEAHRQEIEVIRKRDKVKNFFSGSNPLWFSRKIAKKIKDLNQMLDKVSKDKVMFSFNVSQISNDKGTPRNRETHSLEDVSMFVGRENDKSEIIDMLLDFSNDQQIHRFILIVAMGGVGKTSLARIIYGDDVVRQHFEIRLWVCVSDNSNQLQVFNQLLESINEKKKEYSSLDVMVKILSEKFKNKRYLIVLDDMWKDDHSGWDDMLDSLLLLGAQGSKVIITSRSNEVVSSMSSLHRYGLACLSEDDCWTMLEKIAFGPEGVGKTTELIEIGKSIARKCRGLPLTTKVLGRLMYSKVSEQAWQLIENNEIWNLPAGETKVMRVLKLSYDHLEPHLKQCFRYCSLFPKDCIIKRKNLIMMWMAEGFLGHSRPSMEMDTLGNDYFNSLLSNSFFQEENKDEFGIIESCKMHDLVHDLAQSVAKSESSIITFHKISEADISRLRRVSLPSEDNEFPPLPTALVKLKKLRAFISTSNKSTRFCIDNSNAMQIFTNFSYIRVLDLSWSSIRELPPSIAKLIHLRYLNLSHCRKLRALPSSITTLYNLQTLNIKYCYEIRDFPREMRKLTKLSHLFFCSVLSGPSIWGDHIKHPMLKQARFLTSLISLPEFVVGNKKEGCGIEELRDLNHLSGKLRICNLNIISNRKEAQEGGIKEKQHILWLELRWEYWPHDIESVERDICDCDELQVLEGLQPHRNLKRLEIYDYFGSNFPTWIMSLECLLTNLVHVVLDRCKKCECLPPFGLFPSLKILKIERLEAVKSIGSEFYGGSNVSSFPCLESLTIKDMKNLVEWTDPVSSSSSSSFSSFPHLEELNLWDCPKLTIMPNRFPSLKIVKIERLEAVKSIGSGFYGGTNVSSFPCLESLTITDMKNLVKWSDTVSSSSFSSFPRLEKLHLEDCPKLTLMPNRFPSLKTSYFRRCNGKPIGSLVESNQSSLTSIEIYECKELVSLPLGLVRGNNILCRLEIKSCYDFQGFTSPNIDQVLPSNSIKQLFLRNCGLSNSHIDLWGFNSLLDLDIEFCDSEKCISVMESINKKRSGIEYLPNLETLSMRSTFEELESFPFPDANIEQEGGTVIGRTVIGNCFPSLWKLTLDGCSSRLLCVPDQIQYITSLQTLKITGFDSLVALPEWLGKLASLYELGILNCTNLKYLPSQEQMQRLTSLQFLYLDACDVLMDRCEEGGEEAYKISPKTQFFGQRGTIKMSKA